MPSNKDLEKRVMVLELKAKALQEMLETQGEVSEAYKEGFNGWTRKIDGLENLAKNPTQRPFISLEWDNVKRLWTATLGNYFYGPDDFKEMSVQHDHPAQAFDMLLQKLQRKVS